ncbi:helix-turn-helix transcriptional regulator [Prolixibacteraceae bacterium Z1-6]|uniref:Helix-turn-helix transcriptional regulator n=1 Tax=Draconibacterium aestuarii TaxID=2998507 RepID=A0A9X3F441_9BACT|nr:helix-turn-helix transcriptional regulator [Prolixibacteraceae bacterium Z1-6]
MLKKLLTRALKQNGITVKELAHKAHMKESELTDFLNNKNKLRINDIELLFEIAIGDNHLVTLSHDNDRDTIIFQQGNNNQATIIIGNN